MALSGFPAAGSLRSRLLALGLLLLLLGAVTRFALVPAWQQYTSNREAIVEQHYQLQRFNRIAASLAIRQAALAELVAANEVARYVLTQESPALAAAAVQERIKSLVVEAGGTLTSVRVLPVQTEGPFERVTVNVRATLENEGLQSVLHGLESASPFLVVDNLVVTSQEVRRPARSARRGRNASNTSPADLQVQFDVSGLMQPAGGRTRGVAGAGRPGRAPGPTSPG